MIPKVIHYCWFGQNEKSDFVKKCMNSWKDVCPDYRLVEWNESSFEINSNVYVREAYENKKWAFVSDYVRLYALANEGGFYLDTDVELVKSLNDLVSYPAILGYESKDSISTAVIGAEKGNEMIKYLLEYYDNRHFKRADGSLDITTNVVIISALLKKKYSIPFDNRQFEFGKIFTIFPKDYFAPKSPGAKKYVTTANTIAIHHFDASWMDGSRRVNQIKMRYSKILSIIRGILCVLIGKKNFDKLRGR